MSEQAPTPDRDSIAQGIFAAVAAKYVLRLADAFFIATLRDGNHYLPIWDREADVQAFLTRQSEKVPAISDYAIESVPLATIAQFVRDNRDLSVLWCFKQGEERSFTATNFLEAINPQLKMFGDVRPYAAKTQTQPFLQTHMNSVPSLAKTILAAYDTLEPETPEGASNNAELVDHLATWLRSPGRIVSAPARYCIGRFADAELDFNTPENRGLGRMTDECPRFGGKYRNVLRGISSQQLSDGRFAFCDSISAGYLFAEYMIETFTDQPVPRSPAIDAPEALFEQWVPTIYSSLGPPKFDARFSDNPKYYDLKALWAHAFGDVIHDWFEKHQISIDDYEQHLIRQYFDAGISLRVTEATPLTKSEYADLVTGGMHSLINAENPESDLAVAAVVALYSFQNMPTTASDIANAISAVGLTLADLQASPDLAIEAGIAQNILYACEVLRLPVTPHQSLTLAKHMRVGADHYRDGIPLSDGERRIALRLRTVHIRWHVEQQGEIFTDEHARDSERMVRFGEHGLTIGHKIGEASGCFQVLLFVIFATSSLITATGISIITIR
ncbi:MAG: hypothetical protein ABGZ35_15980 [Planctomycetaceae bacterium]